MPALLLRRLLYSFFLNGLGIFGAVLEAETRANRPSVSVPRIHQPPPFDDFLDMDPPLELTAQMAKVENFVQWIPRDGAPASQRTEAYLAYDDVHFYAVYLCFDSEPQRIRGRLSRREDIFRDDRVDLFLDTFDDQRRAYAFTVNPYGVQADARWIEREAKQYDPSFDTVWSSKGSLTEKGYVVWIAIPFSSLRFPSSRIQKWGIILTRFIPRVNEGSFWPHVSSRIEGRLNQSAALAGLEGISGGQRVQFIPYGFFRSFRALDLRDEPRFVSDYADFEAGLDTKVVLQDNLALDIALNPDFNQVESDEPQVTVNQRFEVFYPEKRPFFLENASYFETPMDLFFSRRIADPQLGVRLTGKTGPYAIGALLADDQSVGESVPESDPLSGERSRYIILRASRDVAKQSTVGVIYADRALADSFNRVGGIDGRFKLNENWVAVAQGVATSTESTGGERSSGPGYDASIQRVGRQLNWALEYRDRSPGFRSESGFLPGSREAFRPGRTRVRSVPLRPDIRSLRQLFSYRFRPEGETLISWGPDLTVNPTWDHRGAPLDSLYSIDFNWELTRQTYLGVFYAGLSERLTEADASDLPDNPRFSTEQRGFFWGSNLSRKFGFQGEYAQGSVVNVVPPEGEAPTIVDSTQGSLQITWYPVDYVRVEATYLLARALDRNGGESVFNNHIGRAKINWQFNRELSARFIGQYGSVLANPAATSLETRKNLNMDVLFTYLVNPWTAVYVGYNNNLSNQLLLSPDLNPELVRTSELFSDSWQFFVKFSYFLGF